MSPLSLCQEPARNKQTSVVVRPQILLSVLCWIIHSRQSLSLFSNDFFIVSAVVSNDRMFIVRMLIFLCRLGHGCISSTFGVEMVGSMILRIKVLCVRRIGIGFSIADLFFCLLFVSELIFALRIA
jgi:hypothetical protein